jgi:hypothetical protein
VFTNSSSETIVTAKRAVPVMSRLRPTRSEECVSRGRNT